MTNTTSIYDKFADRLASEPHAQVQVFLSDEDPFFDRVERVYVTRYTDGTVLYEVSLQRRPLIVPLSKCEFVGDPDGGYCTGCGADHAPADCSYGKTVKQYEAESGDYRTAERLANGER